MIIVELKDEHGKLIGQFMASPKDFKTGSRVGKNAAGAVFHYANSSRNILLTRKLNRNLLSLLANDGSSSRRWIAGLRTTS